MLRRERDAVADLVGQQPFGRPARRDAVGVRRLVERRVDRVAGEPHGVPDVGDGTPASRSAVRARGGGAPSRRCRRASRPSCRNRAGRQALARLEQRTSSPSSRRWISRDARPVLRVALEVALVALDDPPVRRGVDVVDRTADRRQPAGDERLAQARRARSTDTSSSRTRRSSGRGRSSDRRRAPRRISSASRTIESARKWVRYSACASACRPG